MSKRVSGAPRRPRNPVARAVRTPQYRQRVEQDRKRHPPPPRPRELEQALAEETAGGGDELEKEANGRD